MGGRVAFACGGSTSGSNFTTVFSRAGAVLESAGAAAADLCGSVVVAATCGAAYPGKLAECSHDASPRIVGAADGDAALR